VAQEARAYFEELNPLLRGDDALVREELTKAVKRAFKQHTSRRTLVVPLVVRV
jgi:ribonuclease J